MQGVLNRKLARKKIDDLFIRIKYFDQPNLDIAS